MMMNLYRKLNTDFLQGIFWTILGNGLSRVFILIGTLWASNILGVAKFGQFSITRSTINVILVIAGLNIGTIITKSIAQHKNSKHEKLAKQITLNYSFILVLTLILSLLTFAFSDALSRAVVKNNLLSDDFKLSSIIVLFSIVYSLNESIYRGFEEFKRVGVIQVTSSVLFMILIPIGAKYAEVKGAIVGVLVYSVIYTILSVIDLKFLSKKRNIRLFNFSDLRTEIPELKSMSIPIFISSIIEAPTFWFVQVILISNSSLSSNGIASALLQTRNLIFIIPGYLSLVILPILSKNIENKTEFDKTFNQAVKLNLWISLICILPLLIFPKFFLEIYGGDFLTKYNYLDSALCYASIPIAVVSNVYQQQFIARDKGWSSLWIAIVWNLYFLLSAYVLCDVLSLGVRGFMLAFLTTFILQFGLKFRYVAR